MSSVYGSHFNLWSKTTPKYLYSWTDCMGCPWIIVEWNALSLLKSIAISLVFEVFRRRWDCSHQLRNSCKTGPWSCSSPWRRLTNAVSSANLIKCLPGWGLEQLLVYSINSRGDSTHPWGEPILVIIWSEREEPTFTCWTLWLRKSRSQSIRLPSSSKSSCSLWARVLGWMVLNADEKSKNIILMCFWSFQVCVSKM